MSQEQAPGFAAALDRLMAQGGDRKQTRKGYVFTQGRLKGKTQDQAVQLGRNLWSGASDAVKNKYARRQLDLQAPLEKEMSLSLDSDPEPVLSPAESRNKAFEDQKESRIRFYQGDKGVEQYRKSKQRTAPVKTGETEDKGPSFDDLTKAPAVPEGGIKAVGDGGTAENGFTPQPRPAGAPAAPGGKNNALENAFPGIQDPNYTAPKPVAKSPLPATAEEAIEKAFPGVQQNAATGSVAANIAAAVGDISKMSPDDRMKVQGKTNLKPEDPRTQRFADSWKLPVAQIAAGTPVNKKPVETPTTPGKAPRINSLTGLPMGYRPGDALPTGASAEMQGKATDSVSSQQSATPTAKPQQMAGAQRDMEGMGLVPMQKQNMDAYRGPASQRPATGSSIAPAAPKRANDPDIIAKSDAAYSAYQKSFGGNTSNENFDAAKNAMNTLYAGATSEDQARLTANSLKRAASKTGYAAPIALSRR
jgi:hypothetical protein